MNYETRLRKNKVQQELKIKVNKFKCLELYKLLTQLTVMFFTWRKYSGHEHTII